MIPPPAKPPNASLSTESYHEGLSMAMSNIDLFAISMRWLLKKLLWLHLRKDYFRLENFRGVNWVNLLCQALTLLFKFWLLQIIDITYFMFILKNH
jgi:hypothetical protein